MVRKKEFKEPVTQMEEETLKEQKIEDEQELSIAEISEVQEEINKELLKANKEKENKKNKNATYLFFTFFIKRLKEDKLYLFSFLVTIAFFSIFSIKKLEETEGYYDRKHENSPQENAVIPTINDKTESSTKGETTITDDLDITDYVGIYSREIVLTSPLVLNDVCSINDYMILYQIKKDKTITKYLKNDCLGTIKIWSDSLKYVSSSGARYISANNINFLFSNNNMKEVDGETYKIDDLNAIKENRKNKEIETYFYDNNIALMTKKDLVLLKGANISYKLSEKFSLNDNIEQLVYKASNKNQFNFIVFQEKNKTCYSDEEIKKSDFNDEENYKIYTIRYDSSTELFSEEKEIVSRKKSDGCEKYNEDLEYLKE